MNAEELRDKHDTFTYHDFETTSSNTELSVKYNFRISPDIKFSPQITIPIDAEISQERIANFAFHLGMIEAVSYWKSTCSPNLVVNAGSLTEKQVGWWHDLFMHGLGEFYYQNDINFSDSDFLRIQPSPQARQYSTAKSSDAHGELIMVGGGKDSVVTFDALRENVVRQNVLLLNPTKAASKTSKVAGFHDPIIVRRDIDNRLIELNAEGYLNGHTPFSAYLSFLGLFVGVVHNYEYVVASNESSADEGSMLFHNMDINHQYSKSYRYEQMFRKYADEFLTDDVSYFSFLRPLSELQIAALFSTDDKYDEAFCSCNITRNDHFCGNCSKCAFVYLSLSPFLDRDRKASIFGSKDYFENPTIQQHVSDLVGLGDHKPFDCVGTEEESRFALLLTIDSLEKTGQEVPDYLYQTRNKLSFDSSGNIDDIVQSLKNDWDDNNFLPNTYKKILKQKLARLDI